MLDLRKGRAVRLPAIQTGQDSRADSRCDRAPRVRKRSSREPVSQFAFRVWTAVACNYPWPAHTENGAWSWVPRYPVPPRIGHHTEPYVLKSAQNRGLSHHKIVRKRNIQLGIA